MKVENIETTPIRTIYKASVYSSVAFVSIVLTAFILWSLSSMGGAIIGLFIKS